MITTVFHDYHRVYVKRWEYPVVWQPAMRHDYTAVHYWRESSQQESVLPSTTPEEKTAKN